MPRWLTELTDRVICAGNGHVPQTWNLEELVWNDKTNTSEVQMVPMLTCERCAKIL